MSGCGLCLHPVPLMVPPDAPGICPHLSFLVLPPSSLARPSPGFLLWGSLPKTQPQQNLTFPVISITEDDTALSPSSLTHPSPPCLRAAATAVLFLPWGPHREGQLSNAFPDPPPEARPQPSVNLPHSFKHHRTRFLPLLIICREHSAPSVRGTGLSSTQPRRSADRGVMAAGPDGARCGRSFGVAAVCAGPGWGGRSHGCPGPLPRPPAQVHCPGPGPQMACGPHTAPSRGHRGEQDQASLLGLSLTVGLCPFSLQLRRSVDQSGKTS